MLGVVIDKDVLAGGWGAESSVIKEEIRYPLIVECCHSS